jgi:hypothetical protein
LDEAYLLACTRSIEMNRVWDKLIKNPKEWSWSSVAAHIENKNDTLVGISGISEKETFYN